MHIADIIIFGFLFDLVSSNMSKRFIFITILIASSYVDNILSSVFPITLLIFMISILTLSLSLTVIFPSLVPGQLHVVKGDIAAASVQALVHPTGAKFPLAGQVGAALEAVEGAKLRKALEELHKNHGPLAPCGGVTRGRREMENMAEMGNNGLGWEIYEIQCILLCDLSVQVASDAL